MAMDDIAGVPIIIPTYSFHDFVGGSSVNSHPPSKGLDPSTNEFLHEVPRGKPMKMS